MKKRQYKAVINHIPTIPIPQIKSLVEEGYLDGLKFPGCYCNLDTLQQFLQVIQESGASPEVHGLLQFKPAWNAKGIAENTAKLYNELLFTLKGANHFSTHIGRFDRDGDPIENFETNRKKLRELFPGVRMGGENVFSAIDAEGKHHYMVPEVTTPQFINDMWERVDFAVLDLPHAKVAARDHNMSFGDYLDALHLDKVEIVHISGCEGIKQEDIPVAPQLDPHVQATEREWMEWRDILCNYAFPKLQIIVDEIAYSDGYGIPLKEEDWLQEVYNLSSMIQYLENR